MSLLNARDKFGDLACLKQTLIWTVLTLTEERSDDIKITTKGKTLKTV